MVNRLATSASDYLQQHAHQPVDWWAWGAEPFEHAAATGKPVLLSVGYASCHWCHVMSRESFSDAATAEAINASFVPIKVDRQQHPDVDAVYMAATQAMNNGSGGWPMTVFLAPDGKPFFAGTYFPPEATASQPSFMQVLEAIAEAWDTRRDELVGSAEHIVAALSAAADPPAETAPVATQTLSAICADFDLVHGGFGGAPKFPSATTLDALLVTGERRSLDIAQRSLEAMARGGIHDQIGGGFHRYAVDPGWVVPHFEKMLYDNALLLGTYVRGWRRTADHDTSLRELFRRTAYGIVAWLRRDLRNEQGGFMAALDADSCDIRGAVHEGIYYLWNLDLLLDALGDAEAAWASEVFHVTSGGTFDDGLSTLQLRGRPDTERLDDICGRLLAERDQRFPPATDRLVVAAWNGFAIESLVQGALVFNEPEWLQMALNAAEYLWQVHMVDGQLRRDSRDAQAGEAPGAAEDYGAVAAAWAALAGATGDATWLRRAEQLVDQAVERFAHESGGFFDAAAGDLYDRPRALTDHVTPSGTMTLVKALRITGALAEREDLLERAGRAARTTWATIAASPRFAGAAVEDLLIEDEARKGLRRATAVITGGGRFGELTRAAWRLAPAGSVILSADPGTEGFADLLTGRDEPACYVCRGSVCFEPVTDYAELKTPLWRRA
ncbi:MAG: thioredoxin domain-containing protein [Arachnia sp.]